MITISVENGRTVTRVVRQGKEWTGNWDQMLCDDRPINEVLGIEVADSSPTTPDDKTLSLATPKTKT
ncbi:MAG: hypothetical protein WB676_15945 [Bryobacteraceae bacterium]